MLITAGRLGGKAGTVAAVADERMADRSEVHPYLVSAAGLQPAVEKGGNDLPHIKGYVEDSGEGRWTIHEAIAEDVPVPVITAALFARFASRIDESYAAKITAALRNEFGGHAVKSE